MVGSGPTSRALESNITSHLLGWGARRFLIHQVKSSSRAQLSELQATSCEEPIQKTVVSSAYINVSPDLIDEGKSFVKSVNKVGPTTVSIYRRELLSIRKVVIQPCIEFTINAELSM